MKHTVLKLLTLAMTLHITLNLQALVEGSNSAVSRQSSFIVFPNTDSDNTILGYITMAGGFALQDATTSCTFNAFFPVPASIYLNGGNFYLLQDFPLSSITTLTSMGSIYGNNYQFIFPASFTTLGDPTNSVSTLDNVNMSFSSDFTLRAPIVFSGTNVINGAGHTLTLDPACSISIAPNSSVLFNNMTISGIIADQIGCADDSGSMILQNVNWMQASDYTFSFGSIQFCGVVTFLSSYVFQYDSSQASTINSGSMWETVNGTIAIGRKPGSMLDPISFVDSSSVWHAENMTANITSGGLTLTVGHIECARQVIMDIASTNTTNGLMLGNGTPGGDISVEFFPGASVILENGDLVYNITVDDAIFCRSNSANWIRTSGLSYIAQNLILNNFSSTINGLALSAVAPGVTLGYNNLYLNFPTGQAIVTGSFVNPFTTLLDGDDSIIMLQGTEQGFITVENVNNVIQGNGSVSGVITLHDSNAGLAMGINGLLGSSMVLNGGTLNLTNNLACGQDVLLTGSGNINLQTFALSFGSQALTWVDTKTWSATQGFMSFQADTVLSNTWTFNGTIVLDCGGNNFDLDNGGGIVVNSNATLHLRNLSLKNVSDQNIRCIDNTGTIILENVTFQQTNNYLFDQGELEFVGNVTLAGRYTFAYTTNNPSTVQAHSALVFDQGLTFSYDPATPAPNLFQFADATSQLFIMASSMLYTTTDLQLTNGSLHITDVGYLFSENLAGIDVGDDNGVNDFSIQINSGANLILQNGTLNYHNADTTSLNMVNYTSLMNLNNDTVLNLYQNLNLGIGILSVGNNATIAIESGKTLQGSLVPTTGIYLITTI